jgi:hypothetical protein
VSRWTRHAVTLTHQRKRDDYAWRMRRSVVGLLATAGAAMTAFGTLLHGLFVWLIIFAGAAATGLVTCLSLVSNKKKFRLASLN